MVQIKNSYMKELMTSVLIYKIGSSSVKKGLISTKKISKIVLV